MWQPSVSAIASGTTKAAQYWVVVRREDGKRLVRYSAKPKALAAALRFGADGGPCDIIRETAAGSETDPNSNSKVVPLRQANRN